MSWISFTIKWKIVGQSQFFDILLYMIQNIKKIVCFQNWNGFIYTFIHAEINVKINEIFVFQPLLYPIKLSLWAKGLLFLLSMKDCLCMNGDLLLSMKLCLCMKGDLLSSALMKFCRCMNGDLFRSTKCCLRMNGFLLSAFLVIQSIFSTK